MPVGDVFETGTFGGLVVLDGTNGTRLWSYQTYDHSGPQLKPDGKSDGVVSTPALGDLDNDGDLEIVFGSFDHRVYAFHHDGRLVNGWPRFVRDTVWPSPALADLDQDGFLEVIIGVDTHTEGPPFNTSDGGALYVFRGNGDLMPGWPQFIGQTIFSSPAVGDLDGDGSLEIVHGTGDNFNNPLAGYKVYVWNSNGTLRWTGSTSGYVIGSPAIGDIDGDGKQEVVVTVRDERVYAWNHDGSLLWSAKPTNFQGLTMPLHSAPVLADYNGDGRPDVFVTIYWDAAILNGPNGAQLTARSTSDSRPAYMSNYTVSDNAAVMGDIDGDGKLELVLASAEQTGTTGQVVFWDLNLTPSSAPWPMFGRTARHTNVSSAPPTFNAEIVSHTIPEVLPAGVQYPVSITVKNTGTATWRYTDAIRLGAVGDSDPFSTVTRFELDPTKPVAPGEKVTFTFTLTAPWTEGYYTTDWRMVNDQLGRWFGATVRVRVKVGDQPALQTLTTQGIFAGGLSTEPFPSPAGFTNWPAAHLWELTTDKRGYYMIDVEGGYWYGGDTFPLVSSGHVNGVQDMEVGPDGISYYFLLNDGTIYRCDTDTCTANPFSPSPPTGIVARSFAITGDGRGVYVVDGFGHVYTGGTAQPLASPSGLPLQEDAIRRIQLTPDGKGYYLMDKYGRIWNGGNASPLPLHYTPRTGQDWARDFELTEDGTGFYLLDYDNVVHSGGNAPPLRVNPPPSAAGIGRDLILLDTRQFEGFAYRVPASLTLMGEAGKATPLQATIALENVGTHAITWSAQPNGGFSVSPTSGALNAGETQLLTLSFDLQALQKGSHTFSLFVQGVSQRSRAQYSQTTSIQIIVADTVFRSFLPLISK